MAARGQHDEAAALEIVGCADLVAELVGDDRLRPLLFAELVGKAADAVLDTDLHRGRRQHLLAGREPDLARGESVIRDKRRLLRVGHGYVGILQGLAVEGTEVAWHGRSRPLTRAEALLTADVEWKLLLGLALGLP